MNSITKEKGFASPWYCPVTLGVQSYIKTRAKTARIRAAGLDMSETNPTVSRIPKSTYQ